MVKISDRLLEIYKLVKPGSRLADIGTDHALIPVSLVENGVISYAIAADVAKGPLEAAEQTIEDAELDDGLIELRQGSGFSVLNQRDNINTVVIAGMGGELISQLLNAAPEFVFIPGVEFIIQANNELISVRETLEKLHLKITQEKIVFDRKHYYEIIVAEFDKNTAELSEQDKMFGPELRKEKSPIFVDKWQKELKVIDGILKNNLDDKRRSELEIQAQKIKEALNEN